MITYTYKGIFAEILKLSASWNVLHSMFFSQKKNIEVFDQILRILIFPYEVQAFELFSQKGYNIKTGVMGN